MILTLVAEGNIDICNGFQKIVLTTNTRENQRDSGMIARIRNMAVFYSLREKDARPIGVFVFKRQNKEKLN